MNVFVNVILRYSETNISIIHVPLGIEIWLYIPVVELGIFLISKMTEAVPLRAPLSVEGNLCVSTD